MDPHVSLVSVHSVVCSLKKLESHLCISSPLYQNQRKQKYCCQSAGAGIEEYISEFASCCLMVPRPDELLKVRLFIEGLFDTEIQKEVGRDHPKSLSEVTRAARTASLNAEGSEKALEEHPRDFAARRSRIGQLSRS